ncbi:MAG TPA: single-stranded DNA-binding protein [Roseiflexaceae bacterium]|nr:single-stranded DNA-binding protein [Roseiflexaceae bacterium]
MEHIKGTVNRVELLGWLGADPELRFTPSGTAVCKMRVATRRIARAASGERSYETEWTTVEAWERQAERCNTYLHKGSRVLITGSLRTDSWEDRESGQRRSRTLVRADEVVFLDARPDDPADADHDEAAPEPALEGEDLPF